jgi:hypothetical protein
MKKHEEFAAWIGLDWADRAHYVSLRGADSDRVQCRELTQQPEAIYQWMIDPRPRFGGRPVALAVELSHPFRVPIPRVRIFPRVAPAA